MSETAVRADRHELFTDYLATGEQVRNRINEMAIDVVHRYNDKRPYFICLLNGGAPFASSLMRAVADYEPDFHPPMHYMHLSTYRDGRVAKKPVLKSEVDTDIDLRGKRVVLVDDVLDTGKTVFAARKLLMEERGVSDVDLITLVEKDANSLAEKNHMRVEIPTATMHGFAVDGRAWLVGMGMDDMKSAHVSEGFRWASFIAIANPEVLV